MDSNNGRYRIDKFLRSEGSGVPGFYTQPRTPVAPISIPHPQAHAYDEPRPLPAAAASPTYSPSSSGSRSSTSGESVSDAPSRQSSVSSAPSLAPPWHPLTLNQVLTMAPYNYGYDLPCEFTSTGCNLRFQPEDFEDWISHSKSHFIGLPPPLKTVCTFCDRGFDCSYNPHEASSTWNNRMIHIGSHFHENRRWDGVEVNHPRPDFWTLQYMSENGLISREDYSQVIGYTERPKCDNTHPLGYKPPETLVKEERNSRARHDLGKEDRQRRKEKGSGRIKGKDRTHRHHS